MENREEEEESRKCRVCKNDLDTRAVNSGEEDIEEIRFFGEIPIVMGWNPHKRTLYFDSTNENEEFTLGQCGRVLIVGALNHTSTTQRCFCHISVSDLYTKKCLNTTHNRYRDQGHMLSLDLSQIEYPDKSHIDHHLTDIYLEFMSSQETILTLYGLNLLNCHRDPTLQSRRNIALNNEVFTPGQVVDLDCPDLIEFRERYQNALDYLEKWGKVAEADMLMRFKEKLVNVPQLHKRNHWALQIKNETAPPIDTTGKSAEVKICNRSFSSNDYTIDGVVKQVKPYEKIEGKR